MKKKKKRSCNFEYVSLMSISNVCWNLNLLASAYVIKSINRKEIKFEMFIQLIYLRKQNCQTNLKVNNVKNWSQDIWTVDIGLEWNYIHSN